MIYWVVTQDLPPAPSLFACTVRLPRLLSARPLVVCCFYVLKIVLHLPTAHKEAYETSTCEPTPRLSDWALHHMWCIAPPFHRHCACRSPHAPPARRRLGGPHHGGRVHAGQSGLRWG